MFAYLGAVRGGISATALFLPGRPVSDAVRGRAAAAVHRVGLSRADRLADLCTDRPRLE